MSAAGGVPISHEAGDICDPVFRDRLVTVANERLGGIDAVVAAAGGGAIGSFRRMTPETFAEIIDLDLIAPAELVRRSLPDLSRGDDPVVVLVGSILGLHPLPLHGEYCAAKAALRSLAGTLRVELAGDGIGVLLVSLGPTVSEFWDALVTGERPPWSRGRRMPTEAAAAAIVRGMERRRGDHARVAGGRLRDGGAFPARLDRSGGRQAATVRVVRTIELRRLTGEDGRILLFVSPRLRAARRSRATVPRRERRRSP